MTQSCRFTAESEDLFLSHWSNGLVFLYLCADCLLWNVVAFAM